MPGYYRADCLRTCSALTGSVICGLHRHDPFQATIRDMLSDRPRFCCKLTDDLGRGRDTIWRWGLPILAAVGKAADEAFTGIVEINETHQRESGKGSREWGGPCAGASNRVRRDICDPSARAAV